MKPLLVVVSLLLVPLSGLSQPNQSSSPVPGAMPCPERNWGMPTNGICGEAAVIWSRGVARLPDIAVNVINTNRGGFFGPDSSTNEVKAFVDSAFSDQALYFSPTNLFCGPLELRGPNGLLLPPLKPGIASPQAYPPTFNLGASKKNNRNFPADFPLPLESWNARLAEFRVEDYYQVKEPGEYRLSVWPKIYKRASTNSDICVRVDLPPVSVTIKWDAETNN